jgi:hypothetical protein
MGERKCRRFEVESLPRIGLLNRGWQNHSHSALAFLSSLTFERLVRLSWQYSEFRFAAVLWPNQKENSLEFFFTSASVSIMGSGLSLRHNMIRFHDLASICIYLHLWEADFLSDTRFAFHPSERGNLFE